MSQNLPGMDSSSSNHLSESNHAFGVTKASLLHIASSKLDIGNFEELCTVINFINRSKQCLQTACFW